jgi:hypothetical protein
MLMYIFTFIGFSAWVLNFIVILSTNNGYKVTTHLPWGYGECKDGSVTCDYINLGIWNYQSQPKNLLVSYSATACSGDFCDDCSDAQRATITFASITFALITIGLYINIQRISSVGNTRMNQIIGAVTSLLAVFSGMISVISFSRGCLKSAEDATIFENIVDDWYYGPAFILLVLALLLKAVDFIGNIITPTGDVASSNNNAAPAQEIKHTAVPSSDI